jgi:hypothetical protein
MYTLQPISINRQNVDMTSSDTKCKSFVHAKKHLAAVVTAVLFIVHDANDSRQTAMTNSFVIIMLF